MKGDADQVISENVIKFIVIVIIIGLALVFFLFQSGVMDKALASISGTLGYFA